MPNNHPLPGTGLDRVGAVQGDVAPRANGSEVGGISVAVGGQVRSEWFTDLSGVLSFLNRLRPPLWRLYGFASVYSAR